MKLKNVLLTGLSFVLVAAVAIGGTFAYLTSTDDDVNVMTLGNVAIAQHEYERVVNADGTYATKTIDNVTSYVLKDFTQAKPLLPSAIDTTTWEGWDWDSTVVRMTQVDSYGGMQVFKAASNAQDKFVTIENTGDTDAYVRTLVAIEIGSTDGSLIGTSYHSTWTDTDFDPSTTKVSDPLYIQIDGKNYMLQEYIYAGGQLSDGSWRHENGILPAGDTSYPNLSQVYIKSVATNEDMEKIDGNDNGTLDILVVSQAVQAEGFASAETALDAAFGDITTTNHPWVDGVFVPDHFVSNLDELKEAFAEGGNIKLTDDIKFEKIVAIEPDKEVYLDLNGKTITVDQGTNSNTLIYVKDGAKLIVDGNGTIDLEGVSTMAIFAPYGELVIENGTFIRDEVTSVTNKTTGLFMGCKSTASNVTINGGYFDSGYYDENAADIEAILAGTKEFTETSDDIAKRGNSKDTNKVRVALKDNVSALLNHSGYGSFKIYGGTFVGANPAWGDEGCMLPTTPNYLRPWSYYQGALLDGQVYNADKLEIHAGYTITQSVNADGVPVYTVNYSK